MNRWVSFRQIKDAVPLGAVLEHYGWKSLRRRGDHVQGRCPLHSGQRADTFHADLRHHGFHCFCCQAHGSVLDLVAALERCSLRQAALWIAEWSGAEGRARRREPASAVPTISGNRTASHVLKALGHGGSAPFGKTSWNGTSSYDRPSQRIREKESSVPLRFTLRPVDGGHTYLHHRGIEVDTAAHFGVGYYAGPGLLHGRVVIPIHNEHGQLLAYAGRAIDGTGPKYKLPAGFEKSRLLFNLHRALVRGQNTVVLVEGFFDCLKVHQAGLPCVVALMGCSLSVPQETLLVQQFSKVVLMLDGDLAGQHGSRLIAGRLRQHCAVGIVNLANSQQPDRLATPEIRQLLAGVAASALGEVVK